MEEEPNEDIFGRFDETEIGKKESDQYSIRSPLIGTNDQSTSETCCQCRL